MLILQQETCRKKQQDTFFQHTAPLHSAFYVDGFERNGQSGVCGQMAFSVDLIFGSILVLYLMNETQSN